jgi:hypothetical protein
MTLRVRVDRRRVRVGTDETFPCFIEPSEERKRLVRPRFKKKPSAATNKAKSSERVLLQPTLRLPAGCDRGQV